ncbi:MAG: glycosyltransferase, partial [Acidobacteriaceae bacterium]|nr:glycosyltransferase [Acidobacteriaceae bacterium]
MSKNLPLTSNVSILIPAFGAADKLAVCLQSLREHVPVDCSVFVLDDGTPNDSVRACCIQYAFENLTYARSERNRGFVATCNWGWSDIAPKHHDILLLNSDTKVTAGFLQEMLRVLYLHERHAAVCPRSNNATIYSVPLNTPGIPPEESYWIWQTIHPDLPDYTLMPTAVGFCMLVKSVILDRFGFFDEVYSPGYNEENDFICRINRYGYSAVAANHAFVFHYENSTFGARRRGLERRNSDILRDRYPEYEGAVTEYVQYSLDPLERFAGLRRQSRPAILYDLFHLMGHHSGTSEFALNLLREIHTLIEDECDLVVGLSERGRFFAPELNGYRFFEDRPGSEMLFDLVFKPCQIFTWADFRRMTRLSPRVALTLQDIIAVRCNYLTSVDRKTIFAKTVELADKVFTISSYTHSDYKAFFRKDFDAQVIHHGSNLGSTNSEILPSEHILLMGNSYAHKGVLDALPHLLEFGPIAVLGGDPPDEPLPRHVKWHLSGTLTRSHMRELFAKARLLVYPSHYEGYGLPIVDALTLGKPVIALDTEVNRELKSTLTDVDFVLVHSFSELP